MPLSLHEVTHPFEFDELVHCECLSYATPLNTFFKLFQHDHSPAGFTELRDRTITQWENDPTSRWFKIVDSELEDVVIGAANWNVFTENPYQGEQRAEAGWWPEGMLSSSRSS